MTFYRFKHSSNEGEIGEFPQVSEGIYHVNVNDPQFIGNIFLEKAAEDISVPAAKLSKKAKRTDLISVSSRGFSGRLCISDRLKLILDSYLADKAQFLETYLVDRSGHRLVYWLLNPYKINYECIDFKRSYIWETGLGGVKISKTEISSIEEFLYLVVPKRLYIEHPVINPLTNDDFFILRYVVGGIGYYISERIKKEIEDAGCTGIEFEAVDSE